MTAQDLEERIWVLIDLLAKYPGESKEIDPRTWEHLSVYDTRGT